MIEIAKVSQLSNQIIDEVERAVVGKRDLLEAIMASILAGVVVSPSWSGSGPILLHGRAPRRCGRGAAVRIEAAWTRRSPIRTAASALDRARGEAGHDPPP